MSKLSKCILSIRCSSFMIKMWSFIPVCHLFTVCGGMSLASSSSTTEVAVGEKILFSVNLHEEDNYMVQLSGPQDISIGTWTFNKAVISQDIHPKYKDRVQWNMNGSLTLDNVQINDSGKYTIEINFLSHDTNIVEKDFNLFVFEPVSQPTVTVVDNCSTPSITLSCLVSSGTDVTFHWRKQHGANDDIFNGSELVINRGTDGEQPTYICLAENTVSNASSEPVKTKKCSKGTLLWMISFGLIPVAVIAWILMNSIKIGRKSQELNEETVIFTNELIQPTYITTLKPAEVATFDC
ncbi:hepatic and glial cell adhesion molecule-like [Hypanus sabinus]|uniref:hepatic and glial cell adhesion molecule-like n=1 Tax=Hypanus sabinus TaxID=79690 RepID=UPI0028C384DB|nr:hepatic and glial cell adhesion molecule-like isoform X2 [Hypanus sabinus]XP_059804731.1 hepatic and glial cell adhesion molecule-like [Hypanus sabinus]XP_059804738.1 hepatic and glial cell adhesion molecule-like [Hypanus sabinus]